jgi:phosphomannomutase
MAEELEVEALLEAARAWIAGDPDPETRAELGALVAARDVAELRERVASPLAFGTAGLRGLVGAGPSRMNQAVVIRTTRAVAEHLLRHERDAGTLPVVVGFDGRHSSRALAQATIRVLAAAGLPVRYFPEPVPTPLVAYAVRQLSATAGIVVTASHNPAEYNGYKLYASNGVQIIPPVDADIAWRLAELGPAASIPVAGGEWGDAHARPVPASLTERYLSDIDALRPRTTGDRSLRIVYTPLHGVGAALATEALRRAGFSRVVVVPEQAAPDGAFPTVSFPNPEEKGALDLAVRLATEQRADLVLANDPDADRLAVCVPTAAGRFVQLTGNQVGVLLADFVLARAAKSPQPLVVSSIVSSPMLGVLAAGYGARHAVTMTGFKWICSAALHLEREAGVRFELGYEEAIGYSVGRVVRDKDGISAALVFAELAAECRAMGLSVLEKLERLYQRTGLWVSAQHGVVRRGLEGAAEIGAAVDRVAASPPASLSGRTVTSCIDYRTGAESRPFFLPAAPLVVLALDGGGRALLRPSGTEPKLKIYVDLRRDAPALGALAEAEESLSADATEVAQALARHLGFA